MTHSGGKPHNNVGDKGQRFEVTYFDPSEDKRKVYGWSDDAGIARKMGDSVDAHPSWRFPQLRDRKMDRNDEQCDTCEYGDLEAKEEPCASCVYGNDGDVSLANQYVEKEERINDARKKKEERKEILKDTIDGLASDLLYYDRKGDEDLPHGEIERMVKESETSIDEIVSIFKEKIIEGINNV